MDHWWHLSCITCFIACKKIISAVFRQETNIDLDSKIGPKIKRVEIFPSFRKIRRNCCEKLRCLSLNMNLSAKLSNNSQLFHIFLRMNLFEIWMKIRILKYYTNFSRLFFISCNEILSCERALFFFSWFLIHLAGPKSLPVVITIFTHVVRTYVNLSSVRTSQLIKMK